MNNKFENRENKYINKKIAILSGVIVFALLISFFGVICKSKLITKSFLSAILYIIKI